MTAAPATSEAVAATAGTAMRSPLHLTLTTLRQPHM